MEESPFTQYAGQTTIIGARKDAHGNAEGTQYDLAKDGAFDGKKISILNLVPEECNLDNTEKSLREKGFEVQCWSCDGGRNVPTPEMMISELKTACQFWLISTQNRHLNDAHIQVIHDFFNSGKGVFIWGDNDPYFQDANPVLQSLLGISMSGNSPGNKVVHECKSGSGAGFLQHEITTGLEHLFEGVTVATIQDANEKMTPLMRGSAGNLITAYYEHEQKRALVDSAFTRLYCNWDDAGTARFVKNAAAWLVNWERFNKAPKRATSLAEQRTQIGTQLNKKTTEHPQRNPVSRLKSQMSAKKSDEKPKQTLRSQGSQWKNK